ncbi:DUF397 domain-containing protein [Streptomyces sp. PDY-4]|jgi:hypothetical protein|uniref:DUF397 domain-containing protein n=1 Tax=Streptomyces TaxID=1883 RepID=UPI00114EA59E|nr:DUF397 domain-containing protein [Streptomyces sp. SLBN-134]TQL21017.1 uncharacterized protein DUF397 [Streptomyces sp. SLBN-134]
MTLKPSAEADGKLEWIKSSYSSDDGPSCVEVATTSAIIHVRDSKIPDGHHLALTPTTWAAFLPYASER